MGRPPRSVTRWVRRTAESNPAVEGGAFDVGTVFDLEFQLAPRPMLAGTGPKPLGIGSASLWEVEHFPWET
jgi:hypothetical protein